MSVIRRWASLLALVAAAATARRAHAQPVRPDEPPPPSEPLPSARDACVDAFESAQVWRDAGRLREARDALVACSVASCPDLLRRKCVEWLGQVTLDLPSIVVQWTGLDHERRFHAHACLDDGEPIPIDGRAFAVDPGVHRLRVDDGETTRELDVVAIQGRKNQIVEVHPASESAPALPVAPAEPPSQPASAIAWAGYVSLSVASAGLVLGAVAGSVALERGATLRETCPSAEGCPRAELDEARAIAGAATAGFSIAGTGGVAAIVLLLWPSDAPEAPDPSVTLVVGAGWLGLRGGF